MQWMRVHPAAVRCDVVSHQVWRARHVRTTGIGGEVRHGVTKIRCFVRDISTQACNTSPPQGVALFLESHGRNIQGRPGTARLQRVSCCFSGHLLGGTTCLTLLVGYGLMCLLFVCVCRVKDHDIHV